jgi:hypothetical protein
MSQTGASHHSLGSIDVDGQRYDVSLRVAYDGIEHVGRLWFIPEDRLPLSDHGSALSGATLTDAIEAARRLTPDDLTRRFRRAQTEKRRYHGLREATGELLAKVKYMNRVAISMRAGVIDREGAAQELELIEQQMIDIVRRFRALAGIEV